MNGSFKYNRLFVFTDKTFEYAVYTPLTNAKDPMKPGYTEPSSCMIDGARANRVRELSVNKGREPIALDQGAG